MDPRALAADWQQTAHTAGAARDDATRAAVRRAGTQLLACWQEPHRRYHDVVHLAAVLRALDDLADHPPAVRLAAWFHDAVYDGQPGADEEASAALAEQTLAGLGVPAATVAETARLVRLTVAHDPAPGDVAGELLCDADLAVLAADEQRYADYAAAIRQEYAGVPDAEFRRGRALVLDSLLRRESLFRTPSARTRWEAAARANLTAELRHLTS